MTEVVWEAESSLGPGGARPGRGSGPQPHSIARASISDPRGKLDKSQGRSQVRQICLNTAHKESEIE